MHFPPALLMVLAMLASAVVAVVVFRRLKLSPMLGYLFAGAVIGPYGLKAVTDLEVISHMAEFGVVFLMFVIGLELSFARLIAMRRHVFGLGTLQVVLTGGALGMIAFRFLPTAEAALIVGAGMALSSTALVLQLVEEHHLQNRQLGRISLSVLLMQDLMVVPMLVLVPLLGKGGHDLWGSLGNAGLNAVVALGAAFLVGRTLLRPVLRMVASAGSSEIFEAFTLLLALGMAALFHASGLSMALGAFVAGLLVAETEYKHQVEADIQPFKGLLLGLFFMFVGMQLDVRTLLESWQQIAFMVVGLMAVKATILATLARLFGTSNSKSVQTGMLLAQGGEFGFVLFAMAEDARLINPATTALLLATITLSMALTPLAFAVGRRLAPKLNPVKDVNVPSPRMEDTFDISDHVIIVGFGRVGQTIGRLLAEEDVRYLAIEMDPNLVHRNRAGGMPVYYGDGAKEDILKSLRVDRAACAVITVNSFDAAMRAIAALQLYAPDLPILARSSDLAELKQLEAAGAQIAISEKYEAALQLGREVLRYSHVADSEIGRILEVYRARDYELAAEATLERALSDTHPHHHGKRRGFLTSRISLAHKFRTHEG